MDNHYIQGAVEWRCSCGYDPGNRHDLYHHLYQAWLEQREKTKLVK